MGFQSTYSIAQRRVGVVIAKHHARVQKVLNAVSLAGRWWPNIVCWLGSFVILPVIRTSIAKKPLTFVIFRGVWSPCHPPPWIRLCYIIHVTYFSRLITLIHYRRYVKVPAFACKLGHRFVFIESTLTWCLNYND